MSAFFFWKGAGTVVSPTLVDGRMVPDPGATKAGI